LNLTSGRVTGVVHASRAWSCQLQLSWRFRRRRLPMLQHYWPRNQRRFTVVVIESAYSGFYAHAHTLLILISTNGIMT